MLHLNVLHLFFDFLHGSPITEADSNLQAR